MTNPLPFDEFADLLADCVSEHVKSGGVLATQPRRLGSYACRCPLGCLPYSGPYPAPMNAHPSISSENARQLAAGFDGYDAVGPYADLGRFYRKQALR